MSNDALEAQICGLAARLAADECRWLELVGEFDSRKAYAAWECRSTSHWLSWHCGLSLRAGREKVRVARALRRFSTVRSEFAAGRLSYSKVRGITRVATSATEASLVDLAQAGTAAQFDRICSGYAHTDRTGVDPDEPDDGSSDEPTPADIDASEQAHADERAERQQVRIWHDDDGLMHLEAVLSPEVGAQVEAALASVMAHLDGCAGEEGDQPDDADQTDQTDQADQAFGGEGSASNRSGGPAGPPDRPDPPGPPGPPGPPDPGARATAPRPVRRRATRLDGLVELARAYLTGHSVSPSVERRHLVALVDAGVLTRQADLGIDGTGRCTLNGQRLTPEAARELGASAALTMILLDHRGLPLSVGRRSRWATTAQRLALLVRDQGGCRFPGCHSDHVDAHHIVWWEHDGTTDTWNLVLFCTFHHHLVHRESYRVQYDPATNELRVFRPDGREVQARDVDLEAAGPAPTLDDDSLTPGEEGTRLDLDIIVGNLAWLDDRARSARQDLVDDDQVEQDEQDEQDEPVDQDDDWGRWAS